MIGMWCHASRPPWWGWSWGSSISERRGHYKSWISSRYGGLPSATHFRSSSLILFSLFIDWGGVRVPRQGQGPQFQVLMACSFRVPADAWKPRSSCGWSVTLFNLAQCNGNNILRLLDVFIVFLFLTKCILQAFRFQFLWVFMLENCTHSPLFSIQNVPAFKYE